MFYQLGLKGMVKLSMGRVGWKKEARERNVAKFSLMAKLHKKVCTYVCA
jgi:hypothetical protein